MLATTRHQGQSGYRGRGGVFRNGGFSRSNTPGTECDPGPHGTGLTFTHLSVNGVVAAVLLRRVALFLLLGVVVDVWGAIWTDRQTDGGHLRTRSLLGSEGGTGGEVAPTRHLGFGPFVVDGLAGQRVDSDLGHRH